MEAGNNKVQKTRQQILWIQATVQKPVIVQKTGKVEQTGKNGLNIVAKKLNKQTGRVEKE